MKYFCFADLSMERDIRANLHETPFKISSKRFSTWTL